MIWTAADVVSAALTPPALAVFMARRYRTYHLYYGWIGGAIFGAVAWAIEAAWLPTMVSAASAILAAVLWWLSRRRRRRSPKLAGAKSKARLAAVVRTLRERTVPRPVYRPQPQGA